jgi:uncharacterized metal-binding protein
MSDYAGHTKFNLLLLLPASGAIALVVGLPLQSAVIAAATFAYGTLFMSPDLDLAYQIRLFSLRGFLSLPFRSYARLFSHRGLSHNPFFGTLTRIGWLVMWIVFGLFLWNLAAPTLHLRPARPFEEYLRLYKPQLLCALAGLFLADLGHLFLDKYGKK